MKLGKKKKKKYYGILRWARGLWALALGRPDKTIFPFLGVFSTEFLFLSALAACRCTQMRAVSHIRMIIYNQRLPAPDESKKETKLDLSIGHD